MVLYKMKKSVKAINISGLGESPALGFSVGSTAPEPQAAGSVTVSE